MYCTKKNTAFCNLFLLNCTVQTLIKNIVLLFLFIILLFFFLIASTVLQSQKKNKVKLLKYHFQRIPSIVKFSRKKTCKKKSCIFLYYTFTKMIKSLNSMKKSTFSYVCALKQKKKKYENILNRLIEKIVFSIFFSVHLYITNFR